MNAAERKIISTPSAPKAIGPYAQAVQYGDLMFVSGMIPLDPETGELVTGTFEAEVVRVIENIKAIVEAGGMCLKNVLKSTVFLKDLGNFGTFNEIYRRYFGDILPARETIQAAKLPRDVSIEMSVICGK
ncbi:MAG: RidA family protein [Deltaproteobacteria bacterium]|nr:RidA family protein [Deltaproteobacteria bacterium]